MPTDWVLAINRGDIAPITAQAMQPLDAATLLAEAAATQGRSVDPHGEIAAVREPLEILTESLEREADLTIYGRWLTRRFLLRILEVRLQLAAYVAEDPGVLDEEIVEPIFLVGAPRTGTTILYNTIAADSRLRAPEGWEYLRPVPPPPADLDDDDPRIALAGFELQAPQLASAGLEAVHRYSARMPKECLSAMSLSLRSEEFISRYAVGTYIDWFHQADLQPAYVMQKLVLQVLQRRQPGTRWVLKSPVHQGSLDTLLSVFPDAKLVMTHRDPVRILGSVTSLIAKLRGAFSDTVDPAAIGRYHADLYGSRLDTLAQSELSGVVHVDFSTYQADRFAETRRVYDEIGLELPDDEADRLGAFLDSNRHEGGNNHAFTLDEMGLDEAATRQRFLRYAERFGL